MATKGQLRESVVYGRNLTILGSGFGVCSQKLLMTEARVRSGEWEANFIERRDRRRAGRSDADFVEATGFIRHRRGISSVSCKLPVPKFTVKTQRYVNLGPAKIARKKTEEKSRDVNTNETALIYLVQ
jgi:hypothetical protein